MPNFEVQAKAEVFFGARIQVPKCMNWEATTARVESDDYLSQFVSTNREQAGQSADSSRHDGQSDAATRKQGQNSPYLDFFVTRDEDYDDSELEWIQYEGEEAFPIAASKLLRTVLNVTEENNDGNQHGLTFRLRAGTDEELDEDEYHEHMALYLIHGASCSEDSKDRRTVQAHQDGTVKTNLKWGLHSRRIPTKEPEEGVSDKILRVIRALRLKLNDGEEGDPGWYFCSSSSYAED